MTSRRDGFTLVELLTVFFIIGTLAGIAMPKLRLAMFEADATRVMADVRTVRLAVATYFEDHGELPPSASWGEIPDALADYLPAGFAFEYKIVEYAWISPSSDAEPDEAGAPSSASAPGSSAGRGRGQARGRGQGQGGIRSGAARVGAGGAASGGASSATTVEPEDAGLWVRYPAGSEMAAALRSHDGTRAHWSPAQMLFVIKR